MAYPIEAAYFEYRPPPLLVLPLQPPGNLIPDANWLAADTMLAPIERLATSPPNGMSIETLTVCKWCGEPIWSLAGVIGYPVHANMNNPEQNPTPPANQGTRRRVRLMPFTWPPTEPAY
ncbi:hypothetical protein THARTR1_09111 [Trichoderma harzianum]|uniref:Uncharacterized protein n=1 Tax=Trichoderma harzianum TaxID=5544 RepID=A0A2K0TX79_TRIHA|nr:hypothetical protein THARTR1_09111 [Trichoderma harzianum]